ncbi:polysaccharide deacetylase family protein [Acrocarpospora catenulata]|uniref:polysaccharide deacetylase family protein n=1 Tax=Acrocarpospora catenulata TaxID=2836182 RepID=UPI001BD91CBA|nr:polysaccharide deacetylase family protein [Acrocarpospora catenulata]
MSSRRVVGGVALLVTALAGCAANSTDPGEAGKTAVRIQSEPTMIPYVNPAGVHGLRTEMISGFSRSPHMYVSYPVLADAPALNQRLRSDLNAAAKAYAARTVSKDKFPAPEYNVDWQLTAISPDVVGVRLRTGEYGGVRWANSTKTLWYDRSANRVYSSGQLINDLDLLAALVKQHVRRDPSVDPDAVLPNPQLFDSIAFNSRGDLVVEFDDYQVAPGSMGRVAAAIPKSEAEALLTPFGLRAREAVETMEHGAAPEIADPPLAGNPGGTGGGTAGGPQVQPRTKVNCAVAKCVALTFNDGPGHGTNRLLNALGTTRATFFIIGSAAAAQPDLVRRIHDRGHLVANHTWSHRDLTTLPENRVYEQLSRTQSIIKEITGADSRLVRAPYGAIDPDVVAVAKELGLSLIREDVDPDEWQDKDAATIADQVVRSVKRGSIVLLHDLRPTTVEAVPKIIRELTYQGYTLVTVPELYPQGKMVAGQTYDSGGVARVSLNGQPLP